jgi:hypothetical protein
MSLQDPNVVNPARRKLVAIVIANPAISTTTGRPVGFWWSKLTHSYMREVLHALHIARSRALRGHLPAMTSPVGLRRLA